MPALVFLLFWLLYGMPQFRVDYSDYALQMIMTLLVLAIIPAGLKFITRERMPKRYEEMCFLRFATYSAICVCNVVLFFVLKNASYFYLMLMIWITMLFAFPTKAKKPAEPVAAEAEVQEH